MRLSSGRTPIPAANAPSPALECGWWIGDINQDALLEENDLAPFLALVLPKADVNQKQGPRVGASHGS